MAEVSRRQFVAGAAACGAMALGAGVALADEAADEAAAAPAVATVGSSVGKNGHLEVEVVTNAGAIERINVLYSHESPGIGDVCMEKLTKLIVDNQTLNVDVVAGATLSSSAFLLAVGEALDAAGEDSSEWRGREHAVQPAAEDLADSYDVVVVGTGGAGFTAAISAANKGKSVLLMEKLGIYGGSTSLSGGEMAVPGNWIQVQEGIEDSPELMAEDMLVGGDNIGDPDLVATICNNVYDAAQWLTFEGGVAWEHNQLFFGGHSVKRSIIPKGHKGNAMTTKLTERAQDIANLTLIDNTKATELVVTDGAVTGVKAENTVTGDTYEFACKAVVLASGGFGSNVEMREQANPDFGAQFNSTDSVGAQGDGLTMASAIGAELIDMDLIQTYPICDVDTGALIYLDDMRLDERTIMFNKEGERFVEELDRRDVLVERDSRPDRRARLRDLGPGGRRRDRRRRHPSRRVREPHVARPVRDGRHDRGGLRALRHRRRGPQGHDRALERLRGRRRRRGLQLPRRDAQDRDPALLHRGVQARRALHDGRPAHQHRRPGARHRGQPHPRPVRRRRGRGPQDGHESPRLDLDERHLHLRPHRRQQRRRLRGLIGLPRRTRMAGRPGMGGPSGRRRPP